MEYIAFVVLNVRKLALTAILLSILCSIFVLTVLSPSQAQEEYYIDVNGYTWERATIRISIMPRENEPWWKPAYLNATLHGIEQWNDAIQQFAANYTDFAYLSRIRLVATVNYQNVSGFDIYVGWIAECGNETTIGQTRAQIRSPCTIANTTICLAAKAPSGHVMTEVDMQNIVVHELGHNFALSHSNYAGDVMYSTVQYRDTVKPLSTLDLYAVSQNFEWLSTATQFSSATMCPEESQLTLPSGIPYLQLQIADENLPVYSSPNLVEYAVELVLRPETLIAILVTASLIVAATIIVKNQKKPESISD